MTVIDKGKKIKLHIAFEGWSVNVNVLNCFFCKGNFGKGRAIDYQINLYLLNTESKELVKRGIPQTLQRHRHMT